MQALVGQHLAARDALLGAGAVAQLLQLLGGSQVARRAKFDCVMLLSDLLENALAADATLDSRCPSHLHKTCVLLFMYASV